MYFIQTFILWMNMAPPLAACLAARSLVKVSVISCVFSGRCRDREGGFLLGRHIVNRCKAKRLKLNKSDSATLGRWYSTARVSKRLTDEMAAQQSRAVLFRSCVFQFSVTHKVRAERRLEELLTQEVCLAIKPTHPVLKRVRPQPRHLTRQALEAVLALSNQSCPNLFHRGIGHLCPQ